MPMGVCDAGVNWSEEVYRNRRDKRNDSFCMLRRIPIEFYGQRCKMYYQEIKEYRHRESPKGLERRSQTVASLVHLLICCSTTGLCLLFAPWWHCQIGVYESLTCPTFWKTLISPERSVNLRVANQYLTYSHLSICLGLVVDFDERSMLIPEIASTVTGV